MTAFGNKKHSGNKFVLLVSYMIFSTFIYFISIFNSYSQQSASFINLGNGFIKLKGGYMYVNGKGEKNSRLEYVNQFSVSTHYVTNKEYKDIIDFAQDNKEDLKDSYDILIPDYSFVNVKPNHYGFTTNTLNDYFINEKYDNYPVVGLTYRQILEYIRVKSLKDGIKYRLLSEEEYNYLVNEVENIQNGDDIEIIQSDKFDDNIKDLINTRNMMVIAEKNSKKKKKNENHYKNMVIVKYNPTDYFNLQTKGIKDKNKNAFYSDVYSRPANKLLIHDLVGNVYEITCQDKNVAEYRYAEDPSEYNFILNGGSCFDFYEEVIKKLPKIPDSYDSNRFDRGFRLVTDYM